MIGVTVDKAWPRWDYTTIANAVMVNSKVNKNDQFIEELNEIVIIASSLMPSLDMAMRKYLGTERRLIDFAESGVPYKILYDIISSKKSTNYMYMSEPSITAVLNQYIFKYWHKVLEFSKMRQDMHVSPDEWGKKARKLTDDSLRKEELNFLPFPIEDGSLVTYDSRVLKLSFFKQTLSHTIGIDLPEIETLDLLSKAPSFVILDKERSKEKVNLTLVYRFNPTDMDSVISKHLTPLNSYVKFNRFEKGKSIFLKGGLHNG